MSSMRMTPARYFARLQPVDTMPQQVTITDPVTITAEAPIPIQSQPVVLQVDMTVFFGIALVLGVVLAGVGVIVWLSKN